MCNYAGLSLSVRFCLREKLQRKCAQRRSETILSRGIPDTSANPGCNKQHKAWTNMQRVSEEVNHTSHLQCMWERIKGSAKEPWFANAASATWLPLPLQHYNNQSRWSLIYYQGASIFFFTSHFSEVLFLLFERQTQLLMPEARIYLMN